MSKDLPPSRTAEQFVARLPDGMRDRIKSMADEHGRSMNSQIVHMLQSYFDRMQEQTSLLQEMTEKTERSNISIGMKDPVDRAAVLKVLLLEELMLLRRRVHELGGPDAVIELDNSEIARRVEGSAFKGTNEEQKSYFSNIVERTPLTAILTTSELDHIAERLATLQQAHQKMAESSRTKKAS